MSIFNTIKKLFSTSATPAPVAVVNTKVQTAKPVTNTTNPQKLTYSEKELLAVQRTTLQDVQQLSGFPFVWNGRLWKDTRPQSHPYAYMDIFGPNVAIAKEELEKMNAHIANAISLCKKLPKSLRIPIEDIVFTKSPNKGYSQIICAPVTHLGEPTDHPITFSFMTNMERSNTTHGNLIYGRDGFIHKAVIYFWRNSNGYFLHYETVNNELVLSKVEVPDFNGSSSIIYKGAHILQREATRAQEEKDFEWIQQSFPDKAPKNVAGFRRMKNQNTKNYQVLKQLAAEKGREI